MAFSYLNFGNNPPQEPDSDVFKIRAPFKTDIWRKPPATDDFSAPIMYRTVPISSFISARVTVSGDWKTLYDQGGLLLVFPSSIKPGKKQRWIKAGIEFYDDRPCVSAVAADSWADWGLLPLSGDEGKVTIEMEREELEEGGEDYVSVLKVFLVNDEKHRTPIREITWVFHEVDESKEMWVGMYAAKPTEDERTELEVRLEEFKIEKREDSKK